MAPDVFALPASSVVPASPPRRAVGAVLAVAVLAGCTQGPPLASVSGVVTRAGKPVPSLCVTFTPEKGRPSMGMTDTAGRYTLRCTRERAGAVYGRHRVSVAYCPTSMEEGMAVQLGKAPPGDLSAILATYGDRHASPLVVEVTKSGTIDLALD
jgi:hypothetical protein